MSEFDQLFAKAINVTQKNKTKLSLVSGIVKSVNEDTCVVGFFEDVRLNAIIDDLESQFTVYPKVGSEVIMGRIEGKDTMFIIQVSEIEKVIIKIADLVFEMSEGKFKITNGDVNLKTVLNDAFDQLNKAIIMTPSGPGKFSAADKAVFEDLKSKTNQLLS